MTNPQTCKAAGFKSAAQVANLAKTSQRELVRAFNGNPERYAMLLDLAMQANPGPMCSECFNKAMRDYREGR